MYVCLPVWLSNLAQRLANLCADERDEALAKYGKAFDTSQHQNGFNFRNEKFDNEPFVVTPGFIGEVRGAGGMRTCGHAGMRAWLCSAGVFVCIVL